MLEHTDNLPMERKRIKLPELNTEERAKYAHDVFEDWSMGSNYTQIAKKYNMNVTAVKKLIDMHASFERANRGDTKTRAERAYNKFLRHCWTIVEAEAGTYPALVVAQAHQGILQSLTRLDKLGGHESANLNVNIGIKTAEERIKDIMQSKDVSPSELSKLGEDEYINAEVIEEEEDYEQDG